MTLGEIHCHSTASDGSLSPMDIIRLARSRGLKLVSVTDHNTWRGSTLAVRAAKILGGVVVLPGNEVRTDAGDVLVYCDKPQPDEETPTELESLREWADNNGCILVAAHPFHVGRKSVGPRIRKLAGLFDAIEVWNSRGIPLLNLPAMRLAEKLGIPATSGSDAHVSRELGTSPVILPGEPRGPDEALEWIRRGAVRPTLGLPGPMAIAEAVAWSIARRI
ncbi:MAG: PHP domain-containing protein [Desulfurococcales archaeon]|nr:PHP domain-containing protein [Desulfurococcales archaeon]